MNFPKPIVTREHGSWIVLFVPMTIGALHSGGFTINIFWLALSALGVFMSYVPIHTLMRDASGTSQSDEKIEASKFWAVVYLVFGLLCIAPLFRQQLRYIITFGIVGALSFFCNYFLTRTIQKSITSDLTAVAGLTLSAPSAYYVNAGIVDKQALILWLLNFLFFGCSVFYVHMKIKVSSMKRVDFPLAEKLTLGRLNIAYHIVVIGIVVTLSLYHLTKSTAALAFVPMVVHAIYGTVKLDRKVKFKNLGLMLLAQSVLYGVILIYLYN